MKAKKVFNNMGKFSLETFPAAGPQDHLKKLREEAQEAIEAPDDVSEYADCLLALFGAAYKAGISYKHLIRSARMKLLIIQKRDWQQRPDGTYQHVEQ